MPVSPQHPLRLHHTEFRKHSSLDANYILVSKSNPAAAGQITALFGTGLGATTEINGLAYANVIPNVLVNNAPAIVTFAGRVPGYQGLDQINIQIPASTPSNKSVSVAIVGDKLPDIWVVTAPVPCGPGTYCPSGFWQSGYARASKAVMLPIR